MLTIRELTPQDPMIISAAFAAQGWQKPVTQYETYLQESLTGTRTVLVAEWAGHFTGYLTIVWASDYPPFRAEKIPEIVDFNVLAQYQRRGIGTALMDEAERRIAERSRTAGIGVGLMHDYGKAQILYIKRGYVPDGRGLFAHGAWLNYGDPLTLNDDVTLYFTKPVVKRAPEHMYQAQTALIQQTLATPHHALNTLLAQMRQTGQSAVYLSGTRLDHDYGFVSEDLGILLSVLPEDAPKADEPGYHPGSAETYFPFQGRLILEFLQDGAVVEKELTAYDSHTLLPGQCHRIRPSVPPQAASLIVKTNLHHRPSVVRCKECTYFSDPTQCLLHQRWKHG
ncbi:MAG: GNAT family N-acetyltransferase [Anaerolineales bacterium]|nr:GNAT family N-acetyltransferase [Anaerolineales bacterium]